MAMKTLNTSHFHIFISGAQSSTSTATNEHPYRVQAKVYDAWFLRHVWLKDHGFDFGMIV